jgi:hypothetical protein
MMPDIIPAAIQVFGYLLVDSPVPTPFAEQSSLVEGQARNFCLFKDSLDPSHFFPDGSKDLPFYPLVGPQP